MNNPAISLSLQAKYHLCSAGWLEGGRVAYPTTYASQKCGANVVGIVDYGTRSNKSEMWDVFCYRMKGHCLRHGGLSAWTATPQG